MLNLSVDVVQASVELDREAYRSLLSGPEIKHAWSSTSTLPSLYVVLTDSEWLLSPTLSEDLMEQWVWQKELELERNDRSCL